MDKCFEFFSLLFGGTAWYMYFSKKCTGNIVVVIIDISAFKKLNLKYFFKPVCYN